VVCNGRAMMATRAVLRQDFEFAIALRTPRQVTLQGNRDTDCLYIVTCGDHFAAMCSLIVKADHASAVFIFHRLFPILRDFGAWLVLRASFEHREPQAFAGVPGAVAQIATAFPRRVTK
jgi:hypothetical protein